MTNNPRRQQRPLASIRPAALRAFLPRVADEHAVLFDTPRAQRTCGRACFPRVAEVADRYAAVFNTRPIADIHRLITNASTELYWDTRTVLMSDLAAGPTGLVLVLRGENDDGFHHYTAHPYEDRWIGNDSTMMVRHHNAVWIVDEGPVDWRPLLDAYIAAPLSAVRAYRGYSQDEVEEVSLTGRSLPLG